MRTNLFRYIFLFSFLLVASNVIAQDKNETLWYKGNDAYGQGEYAKSIEYYNSIFESGDVSPLLYYNLANAYYKSGNKGLAILNYEKALKLDPAFNDATINLQISQMWTLDKIDVVPEFILRTFIKNIRNSVSSNTWAIFALFSFALCAVLMLGFSFASTSKLRKLSFIIGCFAFLMFIFSILFAWSLKLRAISDDYAIITIPVSNIKSAPNNTGNNLFILHEGTKVEVLDKVAGWSKIELSDGRQGWIQEKDISTI